MYYLYHINTLSFIELRDGLVMGRNGGTMSFPDDNKMSGEHCRFNVIRDEVFVEDLNSKNGTVLDRFTLIPLKIKQVNLESIVEVGTQRFILLDKQPPLEELNKILSRFPTPQVKKKDGSELLKELKEETQKELEQIIENEAKLTALLIQKRVRFSDSQKEMIQLARETEASLKKIEIQKADLLRQVSNKEETLKNDISNLTIDIQTLSQQVTKLKEEIERRRRSKN